MKLSRRSIAGWVVVTIVVGAAITGCGPGENRGSLPSGVGPSAAPGPPYPPLGDYTNLLIKASDVGADFTASAPVQNPNGAPGVSQLFTNADNSRRIGDLIMLVNEPKTATAGLGNTKNNYGSKVTGTWQPVDIGTGAAMISGPAPDNSQAVTVLLFTQGKALVSLEFDSAPNDPTDPEFVKDVGRKQDAAIKAGLPN
jgi:hypothetical protein